MRTALPALFPDAPVIQNGDVLAIGERRSGRKTASTCFDPPGLRAELERAIAGQCRDVAETRQKEERPLVALLTTGASEEARSAAGRALPTKQDYIRADGGGCSR